MNMLKNEVYIGNTVPNKKSVVSYKVHKIRIDNTHEPIIDINKYMLTKKFSILLMKI